MGKKRCLQVKKCKEERKINPAAAKKKTFQLIMAKKAEKAELSRNSAL